jgi:hypothetical protein
MDAKRKSEEKTVIAELLEMAEDLDEHGLLSPNDREAINSLCLEDCQN